MYPVDISGLGIPSALVLAEMAGKSEKWQVLEGCLEAGILCVLVSPDSWGADLFHLEVNPT